MNPKDGNKSPEAARPRFTPYATMFKLKGSFCPGTGEGTKARELQCVSCGSLMKWRIYTLAPEKFDAKCPTCHVTAKDFYKGTGYKELNNAKAK